MKKGKRLYVNGSHLEGRFADQKIKYCKKCNKCHEFIKRNDFHRKVEGYIFYEDFPTFGKERETCIVCQGIPFTKAMNNSLDTIIYEVVQ